jgi:hypothetical protein
MNKISSKLDWNRMVGFEQIADQRAVFAPTAGNLSPKVGIKLGLKVGIKIGVKAGIKA